MPPYGLEDHHPSDYDQQPLEKQDFFIRMKAQVFGGDRAENREGGKHDQDPLYPVDEASRPGGYIVKTVYQVSGTLHGIFSDYAGTFIRDEQFRSMKMALLCRY